MENNPQILLCTPDPDLRRNYATQIIPPGTSAEILEAPDINTAIEFIQKDTNHRIKAIIIGLFEKITDTLMAIITIRLSLDAAIKTILIYDATQRDSEQKTHGDFFDELESESTSTVDSIFTYPINIAEIREIIATLLEKATTAQPTTRPVA